MRSPKKVFPRIQYGMDILQKTRSNLVYFGLWSLISDLHLPYRGSPPCAIFPIPDTKKYSTYSDVLQATLQSAHLIIILFNHLIYLSHIRVSASVEMEATVII